MIWRSLLVSSLLLLPLATGCRDSTGGARFIFAAAAAGPADASGGPLTYTNALGWRVTIDRARLHVGAVYLNRSIPAAGAQETGCVLPGIYIAQVRGAVDIDALSPTPQPFPVAGEAIAGEAVTGELWLTGGAIDASDDDTVIVDAAGVAEKDGARVPFSTTITIGRNRLAATRDPAFPGANPICKERIVSPILLGDGLDLQPGGSLLVRVEPRQWFMTVDFSTLSPDPADPQRYLFVDAPVGPAEISLFDNLRARSGAYTFSWNEGGGDLPDAGAALDGGSQDGGSGGGTLQITASGEALALGGYNFPPTSSGDPAFVDGWEVRFDEVLVTVDRIAVAENPDKSPTDPSLTDKGVALATGPWAIDLHKGGPLIGKGGADERAVTLTTIAAPFDETRRYAFGYDVVPASASATAVNLDAAGVADYATMVARGWTVLYVGTATWRGTSCTSTNDAYDFGALPKVVKFKLGFTSPTTYINCQNPDNDPASPLGGEEHQRGVQIKAHAPTIAQLTIHTDHPFWENVRHDAPAHFDPLAALARSDGAGGFIVTMDDVAGVNFTAFTDRSGKALPWRSCLPDYTPPNSSPSMNFDSNGVPYNPNGDPTTTLRDYGDFMTYAQSAQGHLNSDGLCFVRRRYASPL